LNAAEKWVEDRLKRGDEADFDVKLGSEPDTATPADWPTERTLTSAFIVKLCVESNIVPSPFPRGIRIKGARITGELDLSNATIAGLLRLEHCRIESGISLRDSTTKLVNFAGSRVCGSIEADRLRSTGGVYLRKGFYCEQLVRLSAATIAGDLDCVEGTIVGARDTATTPAAKETVLALRCDRAAITGSVFFRAFEARGEVRLLDATVGANVVCDQTTLANETGFALLADNARIAGSLILGAWKRTPSCIVSVRNATAHVLNLGDASTRLGNNIIAAQGFRYDFISGDSVIDLALCNRWLNALVRAPFNPQPYEQCAKVMREIGLANEAKEIAIARRRVQRELLASPRGTPLHRRLMMGARRFGSVMLDWLVGYGYRPGRSVLILIALTLLGSGIFKLAAVSGGMVPTETSLVDPYLKTGSLPPGYPRLNSLVYSLDVLLPIIDFQQDSKWRPNQTQGDGVRLPDLLIGDIALWTMRFLIAAGWIVSTLLVASLTGLIRKD
jgi:hypothetical protein